MSNATILQNHNEIIGNNNLTIDELIESIDNLPEAGSGDTLEIARSIIDKTITSYSDDELTSIGAYMFYSCMKLTELNTPNVTSVGGYAFNNAGVTYLSFPKLQRNSNNSFRSATSLANIHLPILTQLETASLF